MNFTQRTFRKSSAQFIKTRLPLPEVAMVKIAQKIQISFCKNVEKQIGLFKVLSKRFYLTVHKIGLRQRTQKLEPPYQAVSLSYMRFS